MNKRFLYYRNKRIYTQKISGSTPYNKYNIKFITYIIFYFYYYNIKYDYSNKL